MQGYTVNELLDKYSFRETEEEVAKRLTEGSLHPVYHKHLPATWVIQAIWGHAHNGNISLGKARELTAAVIEEQMEF